MLRTIGLFLAVGAGAGAAILHYAALAKARNEARVPMEQYAAVKNDYPAGAVIDFTPENAPEFFYQIDIPRSSKVPAVKIADLSSIRGLRTPRALKSGELVLLQDVAPANPSMLLREGERAILITLNNVAVEPQLLRVGANVGFVVETTSPAQVETPAPLREFGPFRIVSIGDQVADGVQGRSPTIGVAVKMEADGTLPADAATVVASSNGRKLRAVTLYGAPSKAEVASTPAP